MSDVLTFTHEQRAAQREMSDPARRAAMLAPYRSMLALRRVRVAADWLDHLHTHTLGYPQYADHFAGPVHLVEMLRTVPFKGGSRLMAGEHTLAKDSPDGDGVTAWNQHTGHYVHVPRGEYRVLNTAPPRPASPVTKTPARWCAHYGVRIIDPDGWRGRDPRPLDQPVALAEFYRRFARCTVESGPGAEDRMRADLHPAP